MPEVSVIIPNYNHGNFLNQRIESVLNQTWQDFELIILDDCSADNSKEIIEQYRHHAKVARIFYNENNSGSAFMQWHKGLIHARGKYIWIAESDDMADVRFLENMLQLLQANNNMGIAYSRTVQIDEAGNNCGLHYWPDALDNERWTKAYTNTGEKELQKYFLYRNIIVNVSSAVFKKEYALPAIEYVVQKNMRFCGDWLFYIQILKKAGIAYLPELFNFQRYHANTTRSEKTNDDELRRMAECMDCVKEIGKFLKIKVDFLDKRYEWIFNYSFDKMPLHFKMSKKFIQKISNKKLLQKMLVDHIIKWKVNPVKQKIKILERTLYNSKKAY